MAIKFGNIVLSAIKYLNINITQINFLGKLYKLVDNVNITFVEGSARTVVSYPIGSTVNRATAPSGASFVGWSTSSSGSSPVKTFTASKDMTVYRVVKYNDMVVTKNKGHGYESGSFNLNSSTHYNTCTWSISGTLHSTDDSESYYRLALNGKLLSYDSHQDDGYLSANDSGSVTAIYGTNNYTINVATDRGLSVTAKFSFPGRTIVG